MTGNEEYLELLIGCGSKHDKRLFRVGQDAWSRLITLDINPDHKPDVIHDLMDTRLPFPDDHFMEVHAYEVLEHTGSQGDFRFFFAQFTDFWRILKPGGLMFITCPSPHSPWALGDPSHTRIIRMENFVFLDQTQYTAQVGVTAMSDFRWLYKADFELYKYSDEDGMQQIVLRAVKPSRISI